MKSIWIGDEVKMSKWSADSHVAAWMIDHEINTTTALYGYYESQVQEIARKHNRTVMNWVEVFDLFEQDLDTRTIVNHLLVKCTSNSVHVPNSNTLFWPIVLSVATLMDVHAGTRLEVEGRFT
jgi:hypothetical protein